MQVFAMLRLTSCGSADQRPTRQRFTNDSSGHHRHQAPYGSSPARTRAKQPGPARQPPPLDTFVTRPETGAASRPPAFRTIMRPHRRQIRQMAVGLLMLWVLGLVSGFANACLLAGPSGPAEGGMSSSPAGPVAPAVVKASTDAAHHGEVGHQGHYDGSRDHVLAASSANCLDFCDKLAGSMPGLGSGDDDGAEHALAMARGAFALVLPLAPTQPVGASRSEGLPVVPDSLAFVRLRL